ncbi:MAG: hypothetical protein Q8919_11740, partial [Bacteroidota bacterium]|nr:hypothetical protein [Bacteroidota bacterium]
MKRAIHLSLALAFTAVFFLLFASDASAILPTHYTINFGGGLGHTYSPSSLTVEVGDTVYFNGDFATYPLHATSIPADAPALGPVTTGSSLMYIIEAAGTYSYQNDTWAALGMKGTINAVFKSHGSITNAGREFYLGSLYPTYNYIAPSSLYRQYTAYLLISTYYDNVVNVSYFDGGSELTPTKYTMLAHSRLQIILDISKMRLDSNPETPLYKAIHITSKNPVTVQYLSRGANSGGGYLGLPILGLGKKYVVASYNDDAGGGALPAGNGIPTPDVAGGSVLIIATDDVTGVSVTPTTKTSGGRTSPFSFGLSKGQCYLIRSDGKDASHDLSGTIIEASKPIVVISGHEDAWIGDGSNVSAEQRDFMIEQMTPVEYWDSVGYIGLPLVGTKAATGTGGIGDTYRVYTYDPGTANVTANVTGFGSYDMSTSAPHYSEHLDITGATDIFSTNGHKISVMQYDERSQGSAKPYPAPSMMTIVPHSRWRTTYNFSEFDPSGITGVNPNQYIGIIADSLNAVKVSIDGAPEGPISNLGGSINTFNNVSNRYTTGNMKGGNYDVGSHTFFLHSDFPFMLYGYGMSQINYGFGMFGNYQYNYEYAAPIGMELNTGVPPSFKVTVTERTDCSGWHICVQDTGTNNPGVKSVALANDTEAVYYHRPGLKSNNVSFDSTVAEFTAGELHPFWQSGDAYCFDVRIDNHLKQADAPIGLVDNNGNGLLIQLHRTAPTFSLATEPVMSPKPDSIYFPQQTVGNQICTTFVVHNTAPAGGSSLSFMSAGLKKGDAVYKVQSVTPALPASIKAGDSLVIQLCYTAKDILRHQDTLIITNGCFTIPISLDAHGATGLITAEDLTFGNIDTGLEICKTLNISNIGSAPFTLNSAD